MYTDSNNVSLTLEEKCMRYRNLLAYLPFERCSEISSRGEVMNNTIQYNTILYSREGK